MKYGRSLQELAIELDRQAKVKKDYVATAGAMQMTAVNENFDLVIGNTPFQLNEKCPPSAGIAVEDPGSLLRADAGREPRPADGKRQWLVSAVPGHPPHGSHP